MQENFVKTYWIVCRDTTQRWYFSSTKPELTTDPANAIQFISRNSADVFAENFRSWDALVFKVTTTTTMEAVND